jgi:hypothetical protein
VQIARAFVAVVMLVLAGAALVSCGHAPDTRSVQQAVDEAAGG